MPIVKQSNTSIFITRGFITLAAVLVFLIATWGFKQLAYSDQGVEREEFIKTAGQLTSRIEERMNTNINLLYAARAMFSANESVSRREWKQFVTSLDLSRRYPGVSTVAYMKRVKETDRQEFITEVRGDRTLQENGYPSFTIYPDEQKSEYVVITYVEPLNETTAKGMGFDFSSEPERAKILEQARDTNTPRLSGVVRAVTTNTPSFYLILPLYIPGASVETPTLRRATFTGTVNLAFRVNELFDSLFTAEEKKRYCIEIYDGQSLQPENLLYKSVQKDVTATTPQEIATVQIAQHLWTLRLSQH
ncbi:CHASE domain-containing protein [Candidatus Woesebacteria bacterium]|nr:CHASE domain-containing protein [Candidatus Woesebacteria bacterium]